MQELFLSGDPISTFGFPQTVGQERSLPVSDPDTLRKAKAIHQSIPLRHRDQPVAGIIEEETMIEKDSHSHFFYFNLVLC
jgi:hypothetical protein